MHDIVHDFAQFLAGDECFTTTENSKDVPKGAHHLAMPEGMPHSLSPQSVNDFERLRTFLCTKVIPPNLFIRLRRVRSLVLQDCKLNEIPPEVGNLIHLRHLNISDNPIKELPKTVCDLYHLIALDVTSCNYLCRLPEGISNLVNLRHLLNAKCSRVDFIFPRDFERLTDLQTLQVFTKVDARSNRLEYLNKLNQLGGRLRINIYCEKVDEAEANKAGLINKTMIAELQLFCFNAREDVVEAL